MRGPFVCVVYEQVRFSYGTVYDSYPDTNDLLAPWKRWAEVLPPFVFDPAVPYFRLVRGASPIRLQCVDPRVFSEPW